MENREEKIKELAKKSAKEYTFSDLCDIMTILRGEGGCPWDREQTHESIKMALIEETYEAVEAIENRDTENLCEELGDMLFQVIFHSEIERERGNFSVGDVIGGVCEKMVRRHPHVFFNEIAENSDKVLSNWEKIKNEEKKRESATSRLESVPVSYPALMRAQSVTSRAAKVGFDFPTAEGAKAKIGEELDEISRAANAEQIIEECGDLLLSVVNYVRKLGVNCEEALRLSTDKFIHRFGMAEDTLNQNGKKMTEASLEEMDEAWNLAKNDKI